MTRPSKLGSNAPPRGRRVRRATGDDRERVILETLEHELESRSFGEISIDDLARGAGLSRSSFYFYFPSKEAVLLTLLDRFIAETDDAARALIDRDPAALYLRDALNAYFLMFAKHRAVVMAGSEAAASNPEVRELWNQLREAWVRDSASAIESARRSGFAPEGLPARDLAYALIRMNEGVLLSTFAGEQPSIGTEQVVDVLEGIWRNSIYGGRSPAM